MPHKDSAVKKAYDKSRYATLRDQYLARSKAAYYRVKGTEQYRKQRAKQERARRKSFEYVERRKQAQAVWRRMNWSRTALYGVRRRAALAGLAFNLTVEDVVLPEKCPVLGIKLSVGKKRMHDASPTVDRIHPAQGYVKGNVLVVSNRANRLKGSASLTELNALARFYSKFMKPSEERHA